MTSGADLDRARRVVVDRGLVRAAFEHLTVDAFMTLPLGALGPTKALLKRFFSTDGWGSGDDAALADAVGPGEGTWRHDLEADVALEYGWLDGRFGVRVVAAASPPPAAAAESPLAGTFDGPVVPEATPNPRSMRFQVGPIPRGPGLPSRRWYAAAAAAADDPAAARLFAEFDEVANVLVGPDFVAVGLKLAGDWERLLRPVLDVVTDEFADPDAPPATTASSPRVMGGPAGAGTVGSGPAPGPRVAPAGGGRRVSRLEQAWLDLGSLHPATSADDLARVREAAAGDDPSHRQVAANLLGEAEPEVAAIAWTRLVGDPARSVRRAAVDAVADAGRPELRPLLETALADSDAWVRWKALRGLVGLGAGASREAISSLADDPDFRVRLEVAGALRST